MSGKRTPLKLVSVLGTPWGTVTVRRTPLQGAIGKRAPLKVMSSPLKVMSTPLKVGKVVSTPQNDGQVVSTPLKGVSTPLRKMSDRVERPRLTARYSVLKHEKIFGSEAASVRQIHCKNSFFQ